MADVGGKRRRVLCPGCGMRVPQGLSTCPLCDTALEAAVWAPSYKPQGWQEWACVGLAAGGGLAVVLALGLLPTATGLWAAIGSLGLVLLICSIVAMRRQQGHGKPR